MSTFTLHFTGAPKIITLKDTVTKNGRNHYLASRPETMAFVPSYGFNVDIDKYFGGKLPSKGELRCDGELVRSFTLDKGTNKNDKPAMSKKDAVKFEYDGVEQTLEIRLTNPNQGTANVLIRSSRERTAAKADLD